MPPKLNRLTVHDFRDGKRFLLIRGESLDIKITPSSVTKYAVVLSAKKFKKAVDRNKLRRRVYHALTTFTLKNTHFVIVYPRPQVLFMNQEELCCELTKLCKSYTL